MARVGSQRHRKTKA